MDWGISVYAATAADRNRSETYIRTAASLGCRRLFTSLHMPEVNYKETLNDIVGLIRFAKACGMSVTADISPSTFTIVGDSSLRPDGLAGLGVDFIRVDYGFGVEDIAEMSRSGSIGVQVNASTLTRRELERLAELGANLSRIGSFHNFYPRPHTGLSDDSYREKSLLMHEFGLKVSAFIPSASVNNLRPPLYEGLPTVEKHREMSASAAAKQLVYSGLTDTVYFGDSYASIEELTEVAAIDPEVIELKVDLVEGVSPSELQIVLAESHMNRWDAADYVIRSLNSRGYAQVGVPIEPFHTVARDAYAITIDNSGMLRYSGELQICLTALPPDPRVNVVGYVCEEDRQFARMIKPGGKFRLKRK